jgi:hypothetical protein
MGHRNDLGKARYSLNAGESLASHKGGFVKLSGATVVKCGVGGAGAIGVLENAPASGEVAYFSPLDGRVVEVLCGATLSAGAPITCDANGKAKAIVNNTTNTSDAGAAADPLLGSNQLGYLLQDGVDGALVSAWVQHIGAIPTTAS